MLCPDKTTGSFDLRCNMEQRHTKTRNRFVIFFPVGIGIGVAVGAAIHNIGVGMCIGVAIGVTLSLLGELVDARGQDGE